MIINESKIEQLVREQVNKIKINTLINEGCENNSIINEMLSTIPVNIGKVDTKITDKEILRVGILAELDAINLYEQMAANTSNKQIKQTLLDIAREEKTHIGEFQALLKIIDKEYAQELVNGEKETQK